MASFRSDLWPTTAHELCKQYKGRVHVQHVPLNQGGYTSDGAYFGTGPRLYCIWDDEDIRSDHIRAANRAEAVAEARYFYPLAKIQP
jgi:hypothetical protein